MEIALYAIFTILMWLMSSSIFLPLILLLLFNKSFSNMWFSFVYTYFVLGLIRNKLLPNRKRLFKLLEEEIAGRNTSLPLKVLEIGVGDGANLQLYPENSQLTVVDMNQSFESYFLANKVKYPQVELERIVHCMAENMAEISDSSMDVVVSTYVLCSVNDVDKTLKEIKRVLKPNGKFLFLEHVVYPDHGWKFLIQRAISPLWKTYFNGCVPDRDHRSSLDKAGFRSVSYEGFLCNTIWLYVRPHFIGVATK